MLWNPGRLWAIFPDKAREGLNEGALPLDTGEDGRMVAIAEEVYDDLGHLTK